MAAVNAAPVATTYEYGGAQQGHNPYDAYSQGGGGAYQWPHAQHPAPHQVFVPGLASRNACAECVRARARVPVRAASRASPGACFRPHKPQRVCRVPARACPFARARFATRVG
jgi:hypothetical protein